MSTLYIYDGRFELLLFFFFQNSNSTPVCYLPTFLNYDIWCGCLACACIVKSTKIYPHIDSYVFSLSSRNHSFVVMVHFALKIKRLLCNGSYDIHKMKWMWTYASVCIIATKIHTHTTTTIARNLIRNVLIIGDNHEYKWMTMTQTALTRLERQYHYFF